MSSACVKTCDSVVLACCTYTGYIISVADSFTEEAVPDLPGEDARALGLVLRDLFDHGGCRDSWL